MKGVTANDNDEITNIWKKEVMSVSVVRQESGQFSWQADWFSVWKWLYEDWWLSDTTVS